MSVIQRQQLLQFSTKVLELTHSNCYECRFFKFKHWNGINCIHILLFECTCMYAHTITHGYIHTRLQTHANTQTNTLSMIHSHTLTHTLISKVTTSLSVILGNLTVLVARLQTVWYHETSLRLNEMTKASDSIEDRLAHFDN